MLSLITRSSKGGPLTYAEFDNNIISIQNYANSLASASSPTITGSTSFVGSVSVTGALVATSVNGITALASDTSPMDGIATVGTSTTVARQDHIHPTDTSRSPVASPTFTGIPAGPTAAIDTNTTQLATTAYVIGQGYLKSSTATSTYAPIASPTLTGVPLAPTASADTNTTQLATTAFVVGQAASVAPVAPAVAAVAGSSLKYARQDHVHPTNFTATATDIKMNGVQAVGSLTTFPRADHVHPIDTSRAPLASPTFTGTVGGITATMVGLGNVTNDSQVKRSEMGVASGVATLDGGGKVPITQLPSSIMEYKGVWNATTNTPTLADGTGVSGYVYRVSVAGTQNLGSGAVVFDVGDYAVHNGTSWEKSDTTDAVASVAGKTGIVTLVASDVGLGNVTNESKATMFTSPVFTGNVTGLGIATGTSFNSITALASVTSPMDGVAAVGTSTTVARQDHVHPSDTTKVTNPFTTKGDLIVTTDGTTPTRLPVGTDTQVLTADSTQTNGIKWAPLPPTETVTTEGARINSATAKTTPVDADMFGLMDSAASNILKKLSWANIKTNIKAYIDPLYATGVDPIAYGAIGDGTTNDSAAIQAAINANDVIYLSRKYRISSTLNLRDNLKIVGKGPNTGFIKDDFNGPALLGVDTDWVTLENFSIEGPGQWTGTGNKGIDIHTSSQALVTNLTFRQLLLQHINDISIYVGTGFICTYDQVKFYQTGWNAIMIDGGDSHSFNACSVKDCILGYYINGASAVDIGASYAEQTGLGFWINGSNDVCIRATGVEANINRSTDYPGRSYRITGGEGNSIISSLSRQDTMGAAAAATAQHLLIDGNASHVSVYAFRKVNHATYVPTTEADVSGALNSVQFGPHNFDPNKIVSGGKWLSAEGGLAVSTKINTDSPFTAEDKKIYQVNTASGAITANLPAGVVGTYIEFWDFKGTWATNNLTIVPNGTDIINGTSGNLVCNVANSRVAFVYTDATRGWQIDVGGNFVGSGGVPASTVSTQTFGDTGAVGTSAKFAREDHKHVMSTAGPLTIIQPSAGNGIDVLSLPTDDSKFRIYNASSVWNIKATYASTGSYQPIAIFTSDVERLRIDTAGKVGIGCQPSYKAHISDNGSPILALTNSGASGRTYGLQSLIQGVSNAGFEIYDYTASASRLAITASGNVLINTPTDNGIGAKFQISGSSIVSQSIVSTSNNAGGGQATIYLGNASDGAVIGYYNGRFILGTSNSPDLSTGAQYHGISIDGGINTGIAGVPAMSIDSVGAMTFGCTSSTPAVGGVSIRPNLADGGNTFPRITLNSSSTSADIVSFQYNGAAVGRINTTSTATTYVTSSDYRLKQNDVAIANAIDRLKNLRPINFEWKSTGTRVDGFFAHELAEVVPEAVVGVKDEMETVRMEVSPDVYEEREEPKYQGIDQSKVVPLLTAALQEAITKIETLESRLAALETKLV